MREQAELAQILFSQKKVLENLIVMREREIPTYLKFRKRPLKGGKGTSLITSVSQQNKNQRTLACSLCSKPHNLNECELFLKKFLSDRRDFVIEKKL